MRIRIHRAADQIGGNAIEIESQSKSLLLDLGLPLDAPGPTAELLPDLPDLLAERSGALLGIVLSHPHGDHYGLLPAARRSLPVFLGMGAAKLLDAAAPFVPGARIPQQITPYQGGKPFCLGPFRITPYLMDHSAYDAYGLLVEADGQRLFYSGDFRGHGRKAAAFAKFLAHPPEKVDLLLMEGTALGRKQEPLPEMESDLETSIASEIQKRKGLVFAMFSAQNIDRFVTFFRAARRNGRELIIDAYMAHILRELALPSLPRPEQPNSGLRVFLPTAQRRRILRHGRHDLLTPFRTNRIYRKEIETKPERWIMLARNSMLPDLEAFSCLEGAQFFYSLWPGYLDRDRVDLRTWCKSQGISFAIQHTSGHAHPSHLAAYVKALEPRCLVPMHTTKPKAYTEFSAPVRILQNGEWLDIGEQS